LFIYQYSVYYNYNELLTRTMIFSTLITANIFLTLANRSTNYSIFTTLKYKNNLVLLIVGITIVITSLLLYVPPITTFFEFQFLNGPQLSICLTTGFLSVIWYEIFKWINRNKMNNKLELSKNNELKK